LEETGKAKYGTGVLMRTGGRRGKKALNATAPDGSILNQNTLAKRRGAGEKERPAVRKAVNLKHRETRGGSSETNLRAGCG